MEFLRRAGTILTLLSLMVLMPSMAHADDNAFVVKKIEITGLQRISKGTVYDYLPINIGDRIDATRVQEAIRALYKTRFFADIEMRRDGGTLIVVVKERPSIASFAVTGNKLIKTKELDKILAKAGLTAGEIFNQVTMDQFKQQLLSEYYSHGNYGAIVNANIEHVPGNRVRITVSIKEGEKAEIRSINVVGNHVFSEDELRSVFKLKVASFWTYFGSSDEYSREKLVGDLESLRSFYMDQGYADFSIDSSQIAISPDRASVYITVHITEGAVYKVSSVKLAGDFVIPKKELKKFLFIKPGDTFSLRMSTGISDLLTRRLGFSGYAFAKVHAIPDVNRKNKTVALTFMIAPRNRVYVRHVNFTGSAGTDEQVFRREMRQFEGTWYSTFDAERSRVRLQRLAWVKDVKVKTKRIPGNDGKIDLDYDISERPGGTASIGVGYGSQSGVILSGQIVNADFMGTGERLSINANRSFIGHQYSVGFTNPYYTVNGVSRRIAVFGSRTSSLNIASSPFTTQSYGGQLGYQIPLNEYSSWGVGASYSHNQLYSQTGTSTQLLSFLQNPNNGNITYTPQICSDYQRGITFYCLMPSLAYNSFEPDISFERDTRNRMLFPDFGSLSRVSLTAAIPGGDLRYYILQYEQRSYIPLFKGFIYSLDGQINYGAAYGHDRQYPPFKNFFVGGPDSVRGWQQGTLGPYDASYAYPVGGRMMTYVQNEFILPDFSSKPGQVNRSSRFAFFIDAGNAFATPQDFRFRNLRVSMGFAATFLTPLGAMKFSYGFPLNAKPGDRTERFQFTIATYY